MNAFWSLFGTALPAEVENIARSCCLVTDIPPCTNYSGGIFMDQLLRSLDGKLTSVCVVLNPLLKPQIPVLPDGMTLLTLKKPPEWYNADQPPSVNRELERKAERYIASDVLPRLLEFAEKSGTRSFWVVLEGQTMIRLAYRLLQATTLPVFVQVMDPPKNWLVAHNVDQATQEELFEQYEVVLRSAVCCACSSWAMAAAYSEQFRIPCVPVIPSLPASLARSPARQSKGRGIFRIGFAGQIYAEEEWQRLLRVLDAADWMMNGARIELHVYAETTPGTAPRRGRLFLNKWIHSADALIERLSACDLLYVPYRFSERHSEEARLCFPSKLTTYLASGVPVLVHGPAYASPVKFALLRSSAFVCDTPADDALHAVLSRIVSNLDEYRAVSAAGRKTFDDLLTLDALAHSVRRVLSVPPRRLKPAAKTVS